MKTCNVCQKEKQVTDFPLDRRRLDGLYPYCRACHVLKQKSYKKQRTEGGLNGNTCLLCLTPVRGHANRKYCSDYCKNRCNSLRKQFDLSPSDFRALMDDCGGRCPICGVIMHRQPVDHNHATMEVTGIVCTRCNVGLLAYSNHDVTIAKNLVEYLSNPPATRVLRRVPLANPAYANVRSGLHTVWSKRTSVKT